MSSCNFDHPIEDVRAKLVDQQEYLPEELYIKSDQLLASKPDQETLNELFHLLKKYDLASDEERTDRNSKLQKLTK